MNDLLQSQSNKPKLKTRPGAQSPESAALNSLLGMMNDPAITGAAVPPGIDPSAAIKQAMAPSAPAPKSHGDDPGAPGTEGVDGAPRIEVATLTTTGIEIPETSLEGQVGASGPDQGPAHQVVATKLFFTGRIGAGKDYIAAAAGAKIFGFAEPLYALASHFFGVEVTATKGKDIPGVRLFLQVAGQVGRNEISDKYPLTVERAAFCDLVRRQAKDANFYGHHEVEWDAFGKLKTIWLDACNRRVAVYLLENPTATVAVTGCRFEFEFKALQAAGFTHWHVLVSSPTWAKRLATMKLTPESPQVKDVSERLASIIDANIQKTISTQKVGAKLRAVWSDDTQPPSNRLFTVAQFLQMVKGAA